MDAQKIRYINWWQKNPPVAKEPEPEEEPAAASAPVQQSVQSMQGGAPMAMGPLIQPLVIVPYTSPDQPMYYYDPSAEEAEEELPLEYYEDLFDDEEAYALPDAGDKKRKNKKSKRRK